MSQEEEAEFKEVATEPAAKRQKIKHYTTASTVIIQLAQEHNFGEPSLQQWQSKDLFELLKAKVRQDNECTSCNTPVVLFSACNKGKVRMWLIDDTYCAAATQVNIAALVEFNAQYGAPFSSIVARGNDSNSASVFQSYTVVTGGSGGLCSWHVPKVKQTCIRGKPASIAKPTKCKDKSKSVRKVVWWNDNIVSYDERIRIREGSSLNTLKWFSPDHSSEDPCWFQ